jgi:hypothetical protein
MAAGTTLNSILRDARKGRAPQDDVGDRLAGFRMTKTEYEDR